MPIYFEIRLELERNLTIIKEGIRESFTRSSYSLILRIVCFCFPLYLLIDPEYGRWISLRTPELQQILT